MAFLSAAALSCCTALSPDMSASRPITSQLCSKLQKIFFLLFVHSFQSYQFSIIPHTHPPRRRHLAHAEGVLYGMELGSVTLKINNQPTNPTVPTTQYNGLCHVTFEVALLVRCRSEDACSDSWHQVISAGRASQRLKQCCVVMLCSVY